MAGRNAADHVMALTDVYTGSLPPEFNDAQDARQEMLGWVHNNPKFHAHAAQYGFEAWLLPYRPTIQQLAGHNQAAPPGNPESVDHDNPPAHRINAIFEAGRCRNSDGKPRDAGRILRKSDLSAAISQCAELQAFVNTILSVCGGTTIP